MSSRTSKFTEWFKRPGNMQTSAKVATFSTFVVFALYTLSLFIHLNSASLFNEIYLPIGFLISAFGIYAVYYQTVPLVQNAAFAYVALSIGTIARNIVLIYARVADIKTEYFNFCMGLNDTTLVNSDCQDFATNETNSLILSQTFMLLVLFLFTFVLFCFRNFLQNPPPPEELYQMGVFNPYAPNPYGGHYNLPPYPMNDSKEGLPPQYAFPQQAYTGQPSFGKSAEAMYPPQPQTQPTQQQPTDEARVSAFPAPSTFPAASTSSAFESDVPSRASSFSRLDPGTGNK